VSTLDERLVVPIDAELKARIDAQADRKGLSMAAYARHAIIDRLEEDEQS
jgi:predicted DNA-binding protein